MTDMHAEIPAWVIVGADVVEFTPRRHGDTASLTVTTIERIGKRDVVLANGHRYRLPRLRQSNGTWDPDTELLPRDDPRVQAAARANRRHKVSSHVEDLMRKWRDTGNDDYALAAEIAIKGRGSIEAGRYGSFTVERGVSE